MRSGESAHLLAHLVCPGRHTVSALITVFDKQFQDWTAVYSLYSKGRVDETVIFRQVRKEVEALGQDKRPLCLALDDTILRNEHSVETIPATAVAAYAMLQLAAIKAYGQGGKPPAIPEAKWRRPWGEDRPSTQDLLNELRRELWAQAIRPEQLSDFIHTARARTKPLKSEPSLCSTLFAATA